jgi:hypothetical protein
MLGQRDVDHSKPSVPNRFRESGKRYRVGGACEPEVTPAGAAHLVGDTVATRFVTDLPMLGRDDLNPDRVPKIL